MILESYEVPPMESIIDHHVSSFDPQWSGRLGTAVRGNTHAACIDYRVRTVLLRREHGTITPEKMESGTGAGNRIIPTTVIEFFAFFAFCLTSCA